MALQEFKGQNWDYDNLLNKETSGYYSIQRIAPEENINAQLKPTTQTRYRFDIPISQKAIRMNTMSLYLDGNVVNGANIAATSALLFTPSLGCIERCELKTKSGQVIYRNEKTRSYLSTLPDRIKHNQKKQQQFNRIFFRKSYVAGADANTIGAATYLCYGNISNVYPIYSDSAATKYFLPAVVNGSPTYGEKLNINDADLLAALPADVDANTRKIRIKWTQNLADVLGGPFALDLDVVFPDDQLILTIDIDSAFIYARPAAAPADHAALDGGAYHIQYDFKLNDVRLIFNAQEDAEINNNLIASIQKGALTIPYEYLQTHTASREMANAASRIIFNKTMFASVGDTLRKIYLCSELEDKRWKIWHYPSLMWYVKFFLNSTLLGEYNSESFDNIKGNINHLVNGVTHNDSEGNYFLPLWFCSPESHDITVSGLKMQPSSIYSFEIDKEDTTEIAGTLNYNVHLVSVKYLVITNRGCAVMNSLTEVELNSQRTDIPIN